MNTKNKNIKLTIHTYGDFSTVGDLLKKFNLELSSGSSCFLNEKAIELYRKEDNCVLDDKDEIVVAARPSKFIDTIVSLTGAIINTYEDNTRSKLEVIKDFLTRKINENNLLHGKLEQLAKLLNKF